MPPADNYFAALNSAVFSDGSFVFIPKGVRCPMEVSTYFRINASETGQVRACSQACMPQVANGMQTGSAAGLRASASAPSPLLQVLLHSLATRVLTAAQLASAREACSVSLQCQRPQPSAEALWCLQFERTLIVAEDDAYVSYLEGCTAPSYDKNQVPLVALGHDWRLC